MTERLIVIGVVLAVAFLAVAIWERRPMTRAVAGPGVTLITGADCRICGQALAALQHHGVSPRLMDVAEAAHLGVRSIPTVVITGADGTVILRRSGRTVVSDAARIAGVARREGGG